MKYSANLFVCFLIALMTVSLSSCSDNDIIIDDLEGPKVTGIWQGVTLQNGPYDYPSFMEINHNEDEISGTYYLETLFNSEPIAAWGNRNIISTRSTITSNSIHLEADNANVDFDFWCLELHLNMNLSADGKMMTGTWFGIDNGDVECIPGTITMKKLEVISSTRFSIDESKELQVGGQNVKWYSDFLRQDLLHTGNVYTPVISENEEYYITQTIDGFETPPYKLSVIVST